MTLTDLESLIRLYVPSAKISVITQPMMWTLINAGVRDVNILASAYKANKKINVTEDLVVYPLSTLVDDFVQMDKGGLWYNRGDDSSPDWQRMDPFTRESMNAEWPRWMSQAADLPRRYFVENDSLSVHPKASETKVEGFWLFYVKKPTNMTQGTHYPFTGSTTELGSLAVLDDCIIDYVRWKLARPLGKDEQGIIMEKDYRQGVAEKAAIMDRRLDISATPGLRMRGRTV